MCAGPPAAGEEIVFNFLKVTVKPQNAYFIQRGFGVDLRQHKSDLRYALMGNTLVFWLLLFVCFFDYSSDILC